MDAVERVLTTINHEEPDKVPAFESAFTNNTIVEHYGFKPGVLGYEENYKFFQKVGLDLVVSYVALFPKKNLGKKGFVDEYGRIMKVEPCKDGTQIMAYHGGYFKSFEDYESWEQPDPNLPTRTAMFQAGRKVQENMNNEVFSIPATGSLMGTPASIRERMLPHTVAIEEDPFDSRTSETILIVYGNSSGDGKTWETALSARCP